MTVLIAERAAIPVADAYHQVRSTSAAFRTRVRLVQHHRGTDPDRVGVGDLVSSASLLEEVLEATARRISREHGVTPPRHVAATRALHDYAWPAALLMSAPWFLQNRVPRLRHTDLRVQLSTGVLEVVPPAQVRPEDPDTALLAAVAEHHRPLVEALGAQMRRGPRAVWGLVTDDLVSGIWHLGRELGVEGAGVRAATRLLPAGTGPFPGGSCFRQLTAADGTCHNIRTRLACCLYYRIASEACLTCPRTPDAERITRLAATS